MENKNIIIEIVPMGNIGNRMIQYLVALELKRKIGNAEIANIALSEWGIQRGKSTVSFSKSETLELYHTEVFDINSVVKFVRNSNIKLLRLWHYCQRIEYFPELVECRNVFPPPCLDDNIIRDDEVLINLRGGEILDGVQFYPLIPFQFYEKIVNETGLKPVFMGQTSNPYIREKLIGFFPTARIIEPLGIIKDFDLIRSAKNIVISVSTFSWLAAYLSYADQIFVPLLGFFNPRHIPDIDLLVTGDARFRYFLCPFVFGLSAPEMFSLYENEKFHTFREISEDHVKALKANKLLLPRRIEDAVKFFDERVYEASVPHYKNDIVDVDRRITAIDHYRRIGFMQNLLPTVFDQAFYVHQHPDVAQEIGWGFYEDGFHHYASIGHKRGYLPHHPSLPDIAPDRPTFQSSTRNGGDNKINTFGPEKATDGDPNTFCCTTQEMNPWWMIDLQKNHEIFKLIVMSAEGDETFSRESWPIRIYSSSDNINWTLRCWSSSDRIFYHDHGRHYEWNSWPSIIARYIKIECVGQKVLHYRSVHIIGRPW